MKILKLFLFAALCCHASLMSVHAVVFSKLSSKVEIDFAEYISRFQRDLVRHPLSAEDREKILSWNSRSPALKDVSPDFERLFAMVCYDRAAEEGSVPLYFEALDHYNKSMIRIIARDPYAYRGTCDIDAFYVKEHINLLGDFNFESDLDLEPVRLVGLFEDIKKIVYNETSLRGGRPHKLSPADIHRLFRANTSVIFDRLLTVDAASYPGGALARENLLNATVQLFGYGLTRYAPDQGVGEIVKGVFRRLYENGHRFSALNIGYALLLDHSEENLGKSIPLFKQEISLVPNPKNVYQTPYYVHNFHTLLFYGKKYEEAMTVSRWLFSMTGDPYAKLLLGMAQYARGRQLGAEERARGLHEQAEQNFWIALRNCDPETRCIENLSSKKPPFPQSSIEAALVFTCAYLGKHDAIQSIITSSMDRFFERAQKKPRKKVNLAVALAKAALAAKKEEVPAPPKSIPAAPSRSLVSQPLVQKTAVSASMIDEVSMGLPQKPQVLEKPAKVKTRGPARPEALPEGGAVADQEEAPEDRGPSVQVESLIKGRHLETFRKFFVKPEPTLSMSDVMNMFGALNQRYEGGGGKGSHGKVTLNFDEGDEGHEEVITLPHRMTLPPYLTAQIRQKFLSFGLYPADLKEDLNRWFPELDL